MIQNRGHVTTAIRATPNAAAFAFSRRPPTIMIGSWVADCIVRARGRAKTRIEEVRLEVQRAPQGHLTADAPAFLVRGHIGPLRRGTLSPVHRPPARAHRQALVLCLLEGKTQVEAAQEIGCGEATVRRRLARARERLRARLDRRNVGLITPASLPAVPPALAEATARVAAGPLTSLASSVLGDMARTQVVRAVAVLVAIGLGTTCAVGAVLAVMPQAAQEPPSKPPVAQVVTSQPRSSQVQESGRRRRGERGRGG